MQLFDLYYVVEFEVLTVVTMKYVVFGMWRCVSLVRNNVLEKSNSTIVRMERISEPRTTLALTGKWSMRRKNVEETSQDASMASYC